MSRSSKYRLWMLSQSPCNGCWMSLIHLVLVFVALGHYQNRTYECHSILFLPFLLMWARLRVWPVFDPYSILLLTMYSGLSAIVRTEWVHHQCLEDASTKALAFILGRCALLDSGIDRCKNDLILHPFLKESKVVSHTDQGEGWSLPSRASDEAPWNHFHLNRGPTFMKICSKAGSQALERNDLAAGSLQVEGRFSGGWVEQVQGDLCHVVILSMYSLY